MKVVRKAQVDEVTGTAAYAYMAKREKDSKNKAILLQMSADEQKHADLWHSYTQKDVRPKAATMFWLKFGIVIMGFTFVLKKMTKGERIGQQAYDEMQKEIPAAAALLADERRHEQELYAMLDEERLHYIGSMVLGLNDALVELTGAITGVTFALANCRLVALTGIVTGISAALSMMASNFLAQRAEKNPKAAKSSAYTGGAYIATVILLVLPYLLLPEHMYVEAFVLMIAVVLCIILFFNYYVSVAQDEPLWRHFAEMAGISLGVAAVSFCIGIAAKALLGIDVG